MIKSTFKEWNGMIRYYFKLNRYQYPYLWTGANPNPSSDKKIA